MCVCILDKRKAACLTSTPDIPSGATAKPGKDAMGLLFQKLIFSRYLLCQRLCTSENSSAKAAFLNVNATLILILLVTLISCGDYPKEIIKPEKESISEEIHLFPAFHELLTVEQEIEDKVLTALKSGITKESLKRAIVENEAQKFYSLIGLDEQEINALNSRYYEALNKIIEQFPELKNKTNEYRCIYEPYLLIDAFLNHAENRITSLYKTNQLHKNKIYLFEKCTKKIALSVCTVSCGIASSTIILGLLCGYGCYCAFCDYPLCG